MDLKSKYVLICTCTLRTVSLLYFRKHILVCFLHARYPAVKELRRSVDSQDSPTPEHDDKNKDHNRSRTDSIEDLRSR